MIPEHYDWLRPRPLIEGDEYIYEDEDNPDFLDGEDLDEDNDDDDEEEDPDPFANDWEE